MNREGYPQASPTERLWVKTAPVEHAVQFYESEAELIDALEGFASGGLWQDEGVIVIATAAHRAALETRLRARGFNLDLARAEDRYLPLDAEATLAKFMVRGRPDAERFELVIDKLLKRASGPGRRVRAFGEMVAVLWAQGAREATLELEARWTELCMQRGFGLFCAYPRGGFTQDAGAGLAHICAQHTRVIAA